MSKPNGKPYKPYLWKEGEPEWTWIEGETVPRYKGFQIHPKLVVEGLNRLEQLREVGMAIARDGFETSVSSTIDSCHLWKMVEILEIDYGREQQQERARRGLHPRDEG